ncbi:MAG: hypothetical protein WDW38_003574 [Sanguina aurantia]
MFTAMGSAAEGVDSSSSAPGDLSPSSPTPAPAPTSDGSTPAVKAPRPPKEKKAPKQAPPPRIIQVAKPKKERVKDKEDEGPYSTTIRLPVTEFSMRANAVVREPQIQAFWAENRVYESLLETNPGEPYTLHDGPPYANGDLHIGHALNKVLKDFINRYQLMNGRKARFVPGWDTHGLPIELKVLQALPEAERRGLGPLELRQKAAAYALKTVEAQREQFKRQLRVFRHPLDVLDAQAMSHPTPGTGVWADWSAPYITLQPSYEAAQLGVFGKMYLNGHIYRGRKPVHWSPSSRTALAEAELEYPEGHVSQSIYVALPITGAAAQTPPALASELLGASLAIWTTTPWTIPANLAVAINADLEYCLVEATGEVGASWQRRRLVVARDLVASLAETLGVALTQLGDAFKGAVLEGVTYSHPLYTRTSPVVIGGDYITTETGPPPSNMLQGRLQRAWGVPITLFVNRTTGQYLVDPEVNRRIVAAVREQGVDAWSEEAAQDLLGADYTLADYERVTDILDFFRIFQSLQRYVVQDLSNFYLDVSKDRLYTRAADDPSRRACQTVLDATLRALLAALAPLAPHTAEDAWMALPYPVQSKSVFSAGWKAPEAQWSTLPAEEVRLWSAVAEIRDAVNVVLEKARVGKMIGSSLEASVEVHVGDEGVRQGLLRLDGSGSHADEMRYLFMASQVHLLSDPASTLLAPYHDALTPTSAPASGGISIGVSRASGSKCARCWNYSLTLGTGSSAHPELCERCAPVITRMGFVLPEVTVAKVAEAVAVAV